MGIRRASLALVIVLAIPGLAAAQATSERAIDDTVDATATPPPEPSADASVEAPQDPAIEPTPETPPGYEASAVPTPPARPSGPAPRRTTVAAQARDDERAIEVVAPVTPEPDIELALTLNGLLSFAATTTPVLIANADLVFALDPRVWIGLGIAFSYSEQHTMAFPGVPDMKFVTSSVSVPIIFQYYFEAPHVGAAVPTLRLQLTPGWSESPVGSPTPSTQVVTGSAAVLAGITWMAAHSIAIRIIGGINGGFGVNVVGPVNILGNIGVQALVSVVVRF